MLFLIPELTVNDSANSEVKRPCVRKIFKTTKYIGNNLFDCLLLISYSNVDNNLLIITVSI